MRRHCWSAAPERNASVVAAVLLHGMATRRGRNVQVMMPYADGLLHLADWYRQLWAESLGKRAERQGRVVETGQTPVTSLGTTDQHSQVQLYMEGPQDKIITFLEVAAVNADLRIPRRHQDLDSLGYLGGRTLGELIAAEKRGTEIALTSAGRPNLTWLLPRISEFRRLHPDTKIRLVTQDTPIDLERDMVDVVIRYGDGAWPDGPGVLLCEDDVFPVCSPVYAAARRPLVAFRYPLQT